MHELNTFNLYAMTRPVSPQEILAVVREFRAEAARVQNHLDAVAAACEAELTQAI